MRLLCIFLFFFISFVSGCSPTPSSGDDNILLILLDTLRADHGEEFMMHGWIGHTKTLYQELVHVPIIFYDPYGPKGKKVKGAVSTLDILSTLLDRPKEELEHLRSLGYIL